MPSEAEAEILVSAALGEAAAEEAALEALLDEEWARHDVTDAPAASATAVPATAPMEGQADFMRRGAGFVPDLPGRGSYREVVGARPLAF